MYRACSLACGCVGVVGAGGGGGGGGAVAAEEEEGEGEEDEDDGNDDLDTDGGNTDGGDDTTEQLEVAWELLDVARVIFTKTGEVRGGLAAAWAAATRLLCAPALSLGVKDTAGLCCF